MIYDFIVDCASNPLCLADEGSWIPSNYRIWREWFSSISTTPKVTLANCKVV
jgi:hypothetical protein